MALAIRNVLGNRSASFRRLLCKGPAVLATPCPYSVTTAALATLIGNKQYHQCHVGIIGNVHFGTCWHRQKASQPCRRVEPFGCRKLQIRRGAAVLCAAHCAATRVQWATRRQTAGPCRGSHYVARVVATMFPPPRRCKQGPPGGAWHQRFPIVSVRLGGHARAELARRRLRRHLAQAASGRQIVWPTRYALLCDLCGGSANPADGDFLHGASVFRGADDHGRFNGHRWRRSVGAADGLFGQGAVRV